MIDFGKQILEYFNVLDDSLDKLSNKREGKITGLPSWTFTNREISLGFNDKYTFLIMKVVPKDNLSNDIVIEKNLTSDQDIADLCSPWKASFSINNLPKNSFVQFSDAYIIEANNPLARPQVLLPGIFGFGNFNKALDEFNVIKAQKEAVNLWNQALYNLPHTSSFVAAIETIFRKFQLIIKRKSWKERRIHRFINDHQRILLPDFKNCFYEQRLYLDDTYRDADFILEREEGLPALLIELENPSHKMYTKIGEPTAAANHARNQITKWVTFIEKNPARNAYGPLSFLTGPKQRMVILGRGLEHLDKMIDSKYTDTIMWTYDLLLEEAKNRWNKIINDQCKLIGLNTMNPFRQQLPLEEINES